MKLIYHYFIILLCVFGCYNFSSAQNSQLIVHKKDGQIDKYSFSELKNFSFSNNFLFIDKGYIDLSVSYPIEQVQYLSFDKATKVNSITTKNTVSIYPNPVKSLIYFKGLQSGINNFSIYSQNGILIYNGKLSMYQESFDATFLKLGVYIVKINNQYCKLIKL